MSDARRWNGRLGWGFIWLGVGLLLFWDWTLAWRYLAMAVGVAFIAKALRRPDQAGAILPGVILLITVAAIHALVEGWVEFQPWRIWAIFFIAVGVGSGACWAIDGLGKWALIPAAIFLFAGGYGLAVRSWYRYLRSLRSAADLWPMILVFAGIALIISWQRSRSVRTPERWDQQ